MGDGKATNEGNEGRTSKGIIYHIGTPTMRPTSKQLETMKVRKAIQNFQVQGFTELEEVMIANKEWPLTII